MLAMLRAIREVSGRELDAFDVGAPSPLPRTASPSPKPDRALRIVPPEITA
jgi:hypothetical protein